MRFWFLIIIASGMNLVLADEPVSISQPLKKTEAFMNSLKTAQDLIAAVKSAEDSLGAMNLNADDYRLIQAKQVFAVDKQCSGPRCWRLVFKRKELLPVKTGERTGAGGEIRFVVDLNRGRATLTGQGD